MSDLVEVHRRKVILPREDEKGRHVTLDRVWRGLVDFAAHPENYIEALESSRVSEETGTVERRTLSRELNFGSFTFVDKVTLVEKKELINRVPAFQSCPSSVFSIRLRENEDVELEYTYREVFTKGLTDNKQVLNLRRQAWDSKDQGIVRKIIQRF